MVYSSMGFVLLFYIEIVEESFFKKTKKKKKNK